MMQFDDTTQRPAIVNLENIFVARDLRHWKEELSTARVEMVFCYKLFSSIIEGSKVNSTAKYHNILEKLSALKAATLLFEDRLQQLALQFEGYAECDDMQCDQYYMSNHLDFREKIEKHLLEYRQFKKKLLNGIQT